MFALFKYSPLVDASGSSAVLSLDSNQKKCELNLCTIPTQWPPRVRYAEHNRESEGQEVTSYLFLWLEIHMLFFPGTFATYIGAITEIKLWKWKVPHCSSHLLFILVHTFLYPERQAGQTKAQEMGGTDRESHRALGLNGKLTQTDTQVVPPFSFLVTHIRKKMRFCLALFFFFLTWTFNTPSDTQIWQTPLVCSRAVNNWIFSPTDSILCRFNPSSLTVFTVKPSANVTCSCCY